MTNITFQIDEDIAQAFQSSQPERKQRMRQALRINALQNTMDKISDEAAANGLTPEILQEIMALLGSWG